MAPSYDGAEIELPFGNFNLPDLEKVKVKALEPDTASLDLAVKDTV